MKVIDAENAVLGRLACMAAKAAMRGEGVAIVNAEKAVITGRRERVFADYKQTSERADRANPRKGPRFPKTPERLVKRTVRGMLRYKSHSGKKAFDRVRAYIGTPEDLKGKAEKVDAIMPKNKTAPLTTVGEVCSYLGWKNRMEAK